jgi:hypothetical protein
MTDIRLFDPAEYGCGPERRRRRRTAADSNVAVRSPWLVLRRYDDSPSAHLVVDQTPDVWGVVVAECRVRSIPLDDLDDVRVPACAKCWALAVERGLVADASVPRQADRG